MGAGLADGHEAEAGPGLPKCERCPRLTAAPRAVEVLNAGCFKRGGYGPTLIEVRWLCESCALLCDGLVF